MLEKIASKTNLKIDFGGGLKSDKDLHIAICKSLSDFKPPPKSIFKFVFEAIFSNTL